MSIPLPAGREGRATTTEPTVAAPAMMPASSDEASRDDSSPFERARTNAGAVVAESKGGANPPGGATLHFGAMRDAVFQAIADRLGAELRVDDDGQFFEVSTSAGTARVRNEDTRPSGDATCLTCRGVFDATYDQGRCQRCDPDAWSAGRTWWRRE